MGNPLVGILYRWLGGLASASFYVPYGGVKRWRREIFRLTGALFSWRVEPWLFAGVMTSDFAGVLAKMPAATVGWCVFFGMLWGSAGSPTASPCAISASRWALRWCWGYAPYSAR